jgi:hypothetical protein
MAILDIPVSDEPDEKEVYTFSGLAFYWAQVLEREVVNFVAANALAEKLPTTRLDWEAVVDEPTTKTLGQLLKRATGQGRLPSDVADLLESALKVRNRLIHHFFYDHGEDFISVRGRILMMEELRHAIELFAQANGSLEPLTFQVAAQFGVTQAAIDKLVLDVENRATGQAPGAT